VARNSVFGYNRRAQDVRQAARDLQATYVLEGSARRETSRVRLTAQLTDGATGTHIWAKRYDRALEDIFAVQDDLTESIFAAVVPELGAAERERARAKRPESLTAWDWYQRGMSHLYRRTKYDVSEAERLFNLALELDNTLVPALCALSEVHYFQTFFGQSSEVAFHRLEAKRLADRAVNLDNQDPGAYCALARANMMSGDHGTASSYAETALALNPASALALYLLGMSHLYDGRANEGLPHIESAIRLSPHDQYAGRFMAAIAEGNLFLGEYEKALEWARRSMRQPRSSLTSRREAALAAALAQLGCIDEARLVVQELLREWPGLTISLLCQPLPPMNREYLDRYVEGLRLAGLPE
jgi:adenylate cyclase